MFFLDHSTPGAELAGLEPGRNRDRLRDPETFNPPRPRDFRHSGKNP